MVSTEDKVDSTTNASVHSSKANESTSKATIFFVVTVLSLLGMSLLFVMLARLEVFNASPEVGFALILGVIATIVIGVGLMALVFHSSRSGHDKGE